MRFRLTADAGLRSHVPDTELDDARPGLPGSLTRHAPVRITRAPMRLAPSIISIDFGTTNSVVAILHPDGVVRVRWAPGLDLFWTVLCFWTERTALCHAAGSGTEAGYLDDPKNTRLITSMKAYLAQRSFSSIQAICRPFTLEALVA